MVDNITVGPLEESDSEHYDKHITVYRGDEELTVPVEGVKRSFYDSVYDDFEEAGDHCVVPDVANFTRVYVYNGHIEAEGWTAPHKSTIMRETSDGWGVSALEFPEDFQYPDDEEYDLWNSPTKARDELTQLVGAGLTTAEAVDFWMVFYQGRSGSEWAKSRGCSHQAVSENFRKAMSKLSVS